MKKFSVKYYEIKTNKNNSYEEVIKEEIEAKYFKVENKMAIFSDDNDFSKLKSVFMNFISVKVIPE